MKWTAEVSPYRTGDRSYWNEQRLYRFLQNDKKRQRQSGRLENLERAGFRGAGAVRNQQGFLLEHVSLIMDNES